MNNEMNARFAQREPSPETDVSTTMERLTPALAAAIITPVVDQLAAVLHLLANEATQDSAEADGDVIGTALHEIPMRALLGALHLESAQDEHKAAARATAQALVDAAKAQTVPAGPDEAEDLRTTLLRNMSRH